MSNMYQLYAGSSLSFMRVLPRVLIVLEAPFSIILASVFLYQCVDTSQRRDAAHSCSQTSRVVRLRGIRSPRCRVAHQQLRDTTDESNPEEPIDVTRQADGCRWGAVQSGTKSVLTIHARSHVDSRVQIKFIKFFAWEDLWTQKVLRVRKEELAWIAKCMHT